MTMLDTVFTALDIQTALVFIVVALAVYLYLATRLPSGFPPGPRPWPIIGNLDLLAKDPLHSHKTLAELSDKYGPVVGLKLGSHWTVIINGLEAMKEAFVKKGDDYSSRPFFLYVFTRATMVQGRCRGILWTDGQIWKDTRRFALMSMRDFGLGKRSLEARIQEEGAAMCAEIAKENGKPFDIITLAQEAPSNVICSICFGSRFDYNNPDFKELMRRLNQNFTTPLFASILNFLPFLRYVTPVSFWIGHVLQNLAAIDEFIMNQIEQHRTSFDPSNIRDFVDLYLEKEMEEHEDDEAFSRANMQRIILDLFGAGSETTGTALRWFLLHVIHDLDIQKRCHEEIDRVIGSGRLPSLADRTKMPFLEATILETLRHGNIAALAGAHATNKDTTLLNYKIPKNTLVLANIYAIHMDPSLWENPERFWPERWIEENGTLRKQDSLVPFSAGPRICPGETLARNELFMFTACLLQQFSFSMVDKQNPPSLEGKLGLSLSPERFELIATPR